MIQLHRDRASIHSTFVNPGREANLLELFQEAKAGNLEDKATKKRIFAGSRWKKSKKQLSEESKGKCAFCETPTSAGYYGDVEHFRPKSVYWWLAYCYDNYLYSCRVCNGKKSDRHRLDGTAISDPDVSSASNNHSLMLLAQTASPDPTDAPGVATLNSRAAAENSHLPNPYQVDGTSLFAWEVDEVLREVRLAPRDPADAASVTASKAMDEIVDANRSELLHWRWQTYESLADLKTVMDSITNASAKAALKAALQKLVEPNKPYSAMSKYFLKDKWGLI